MPAALRRLLAALACALLALPAAAQQPAATAFDRFKALAGDWIDADGSAGAKGQVVATYRLTGGGTAVLETMFPGSRHEMTTLYHRDGDHLVLTHYCAGGNQPRMRAKTVDGNTIAFLFDGGSNLDPARDGHMHDARIEFVGADEIRAQWQAWSKGAPSSHAPTFRLLRKGS